MTIALLGGIGVFLFGMVLLTDGLKAVAGDALRRVLSRSVATPLSGVWWGAALTTLVQSSTATTFATIGFVSAGLLAFTPAVGVVMGANLGTTTTAWLVSQLGFKISLGTLSPPLVLVGVVLRLLCKGKMAHVGTALAGFALLFMGIDLLQSGMGGLAERMSPDDLPGGAGGELVGSVSWGARLILVGFGFLMTVVMFSSSASMTTTLAAVATGAIGLEQAAALIVGQNIGTTSTAVAAAMGANTAAKRTALAHVLFNLLTGVVALVILPWLLKACVWASGSIGAGDAPTTLAIFHTAFNVLGVALLLPVIRPFARMIERVLPEREKGLRALRFLGPAAADVGPVALEAARRAMMEVLIEAAAVLRGMMPVHPERSGVGGAMSGVLRPGVAPKSPAAVKKLAEATAAVGKILGFVARVGRQTQSADELLRQQGIVHAADHVDRVIDAMRSPPGPVSVLATDGVLSGAAELLRRSLDVIPMPIVIKAGVSTGGEQTPDAESLRGMVNAAMGVSAELAEYRKIARLDTISQTASGAIEPETAMLRIDTLLWLDGVAYHLWRALHHLQHDDGLPHTDASPEQPEIAGAPPHSVAEDTANSADVATHDR